MTLPLVDEMLLLGSTEEGRPVLRDLPALVAGAALADLAARGRITCPGRTVHMQDPSPTGHPVLDDLLARIAGTRRPRTPWRWAFDAGRPLVQAERAHLVELGILGFEEDAVLGMVPRVRHPLLAPQHRQRVVDRVRDVVLHDMTPDPGTAILVALLGAAYHSRRTAAVLFPELDGRSLRARLKEVATPHWAVTGAAQAVRLAHAARA